MYLMRLILALTHFFHLTYSASVPALSQLNGHEVSLSVYNSLEELARIVDISYCIGYGGIQKPFQCLSRCHDFPGFELVTTWNTGPLLSDSCGYIAISHKPYQERVIVAFRGTYSIASTIVDLSTLPAHYIPFPGEGKDEICPSNTDYTPRPHGPLLPQLLTQNPKRSLTEKCTNCTVHSGFMTSWLNTRCTIISHVEKALHDYPSYELTLVGHSLGGAVAALAGLEFQARGWTPHVTTFGEPRIGNRELNQFIDERFNLNASSADEALYRRVTHVSDPVPLLPLEEWGYTMHAGEIFISKSSVPPTRADLKHCEGDADPHCIAGGADDVDVARIEFEEEKAHLEKRGLIPPRYQLWQLFFAHRDYFWRLGLCLPNGGPWDWFGPKHDYDYDYGSEYDGIDHDE